MTIKNSSEKSRPPGDARPNNRWQTPAGLLVLIILGCLVYGNSLRVPFVFDDKPNITKNPHIQMTRLNLPQVREVLNSRSSHRPVANFTFALNYYLHRYHLFGYHAVNLAIHLFNGLLVLLLTRLTLKLLGREKERPLLPFFAAALWLVSPVHIQSVTYIVQRMTSLATLFYLLSLYLYIRGRLRGRLILPERRPWRTRTLFGLAALSWLLALGSKEIAATLPIMIVLYEWFFFQNLSRRFLKQKLKWILLAGLLILAVSLAFLGQAPLETILDKYDRQPFSMVERLLTQPRVICHYLSLLLLPLPERLNIIHYVATSTSLTSPPTTIPAMIFLGLLTITAIITAPTRRLFSFAILWFLGNLMIESSFIGLEMMFEHRAYLPSVFLFVAAAAGLARARPEWLANGALITLIAVSGFWTWQRNSQWQDKIDFWQDAIKKDPRCVRPHNNLGIALAEAGRYREGIASSQQSIALSPPELNTARAYNNICRMYNQLGEHDLAEEYCRQAVRIEPVFPEAFMNLGKIMLDRNRPDEAIDYLEQTVTLAPHLLPAYLLLAEALYKKTTRTEKAIQVCRQALTANPEFLDARRMIGTLLLADGQPAQALPHLQAVLRARPDHRAANLNTGMAWNRLGEPARALKYLEKTVLLAPDSARARAELGTALMGLKRPGEAETHFLKYLDLIDDEPVIPAGPLRSDKIRADKDRTPLARGKETVYEQALARIPDSPRLLNRLSMTLTRRQQYEKAGAILRKLGRLLPRSATVDYNLACLYARRNKIDQALASLKEALDKGFTDAEKLRSDPDLDPVRETGEYDLLLQKIEDKDLN
ncbi:MAG: tetratricopeptide repeat protein [Desulfosudaceae bacterium]